ncbi:protein phosphatase 1 regulatory subunit 14B [Esox lucius]|uniref:Protein phosphatase 1 regulatory subunit 14B n=1 Tax=Esox lucius TaxID=8010 RepID=A0A3P8YJL3_ESOLU|nr:protein phosphatase 1 regulatory subunit 14B [Esox lucius]
MRVQIKSIRPTRDWTKLWEEDTQTEEQRDRVQTGEVGGGHRDRRAERQGQTTTHSYSYTLKDKRVPLTEIQAPSGQPDKRAGKGMSSQPGPQPRVLFQTPREQEEEPPQRRLGKLTVKYNRKDLQRRLDVEEWIDGQLHLLFDCEEDDIPELEIDIDELLDLSDAEQRSKLHELLRECGKPKEDFIDGLLYRMKGLRKMSLKK